MREEKVTISIIKWLQNNNWEIICYDFPQSGTGIMLHPNCVENSEKNKGGIIPDIIAIKDDKAVFFENKDRFVLSDVEKLFLIKKVNNYSDALYRLIGDIPIFYGIGIPKTEKNVNQSIAQKDKVDFIVTTDTLGMIYIEYDTGGIFG